MHPQRTLIEAAELIYLNEVASGSVRKDELQELKMPENPNHPYILDARHRAAIRAMNRMHDAEDEIIHATTWESDARFRDATDPRPRTVSHQQNLDHWKEYYPKKMPELEDALKRAVAHFEKRKALVPDFDARIKKGQFNPGKIGEGERRRGVDPVFQKEQPSM